MLETVYRRTLGSFAPSVPRDPGFRGVAATMCLRCGMTGRHPSPMDCITELRDQLAVTQLKLNEMPLRKLPSRTGVHRGRPKAVTAPAG